MPVEFLTDEEAARFGRFDGVPCRADLERVFFLDDVDRTLVAMRRGDHNRLGFSLLLTTARYVGTFLADPRYWNPAHSVLPFGPKTYLPGVSRRNGCIHTDFAW